MPESAKSSPDLAAKADLLASSHTGQMIRRCSKCGLRKLLERAFYKERTCRAGYRPECKKCRNRARAAWARARYQAGARGRYRQPDHRG